MSYIIMYVISTFMLNIESEYGFSFWRVVVRVGEKKVERRRVFYILAPTDTVSLRI